MNSTMVWLVLVLGFVWDYLILIVMSFVLWHIPGGF
jgi:hypothetical protein